MQDAIWAIYFHTISVKNESLTVQHKYCLKGTESWCKYQKDFSLKTKTYDRSKCLPPVFRTELLPIFKRLSNTDLLSQCLRGLTQNQNESLNNILWLKYPKRVFCGKRRLETATAAAVLFWNQGAAAVGNVLERLGIHDSGVNTLRDCQQLNAQWLINAAKKCKSKYERKRRLFRKKRREGTKAGQDYISEGFSIHRVPDNAKGSQQKTTVSKPNTFVDEKNIALVVEHCKRK